MKRFIRATAIGSLASLATVALGVQSVSATGSPTVRTVVSGLDNPRGLAFAPNGQLYVAEAGSGGSDCGPFGIEGRSCAGFSGGISAIDMAAGTARRIVSGIASVAGDGGFGAVGLDGISFQGDGGLYGIVGDSSDGVPAGLLPADVTAGLKAGLGRLIKATPSGQFKIASDVGHADFQWAADHASLVPDQFPDANPYGVLAGPGVEWVVDAASNTIDKVGPTGVITSRTFIPNPPVSDAVPTCIDRGPDGALYVGQLVGGGNGPGSSSVWRFDPTTGDLAVWATGLTAVTGCGFGKDGTFYAAEFSTATGFAQAGPGDGALVRVAPHSSSPTVVVGGLSFPGGFAAGADGSVFLSNWSIAPAYTGMGSVLQIKP